ncbi:response regulator (plasmid) [Rhizobium leguminosarum]|uniref:response regulator n=1 Tax=Rhizobium leguminosarum TaxID=384 RepID=UPI00103202BC|nr:response regulator [Rhizobium leguminosarum]TAU45112.1 response regulator [Rhizobium leguminosarum]
MQKPSRIVLVVEDEPLIRLFLADALEDAGFAVLEAGSVLEAVGILGLRADVDAIFTDVDMPGGLNGIDLARMVASVSPHIGIVVTSGRADVDRNDLPAKANFLPKPYNTIVAVATVENVIQHNNEAIARTAS